MEALCLDGFGFGWIDVDLSWPDDSFCELEKPLNFRVCFLYALGVVGTGVKIKSDHVGVEQLLEEVD